jgi:homocitrate synthase NifV
MRSDLILEDTTLRDGEQAPGVAFSQTQKRLLHDLLAEAGVRWIEAGIPAMGGDELAFLKRLLADGSPATIVAWNRGVREDVEQSLALGFKAIHIGLPASDEHLRQSVRRDRSWLLETARSLVGMAKDRGAFVSISAEDIGRVEPSFLVEYASVVQQAGADRLRLSDTIGILTPERYAAVVHSITRSCPIDLQCHAHNDFGLGTANALAALEAGARYFHVTVNGIGERAGMADLAQMACSLKYLYGVDLGIDLSKLTALSAAVASASGHPVPPWQPIVGSNVFAHESGIHVNAMLRDTSSFEPISPDSVGGQRRYVIGKHSGRSLIRAVLERKGVQASEPELAQCLEEVRRIAVNRAGKPISDEELLRIHDQVRGRRELVSSTSVREGQR